jgi:DNA polymerase III subunit gamma/tau
VTYHLGPGIAGMSGLAMSDIDFDEDEALAERDPDTSDMFGTPAAKPPTSPAPAAPAYQVLARKYRPRRFEDLIGQEAMVRTLANAFASGRIAHAFMLTGVRGVGKTTTARLLARALNYDSDTVHQPSVDLSVEGRHCRAIIEGRHMDVLELDAATRTKVDEMRELLDSVRYAPVEARYKVYIIDEVHMLSTAAFNALLKTLEEPPPHAKFVFATTEIRKVPVTILSRCQRFDLRRVEPEVLVKNLQAICEREGARVEPEGLALIARAAEGSVRDGQSLLDQAIVQAERGEVVAASVVRDMLGLADRGQTIALFERLMKGAVKDALEAFRTLYGFGADPVQVMLDLLEHAHASSVARMLGPDALGLPGEQAARLTAVGAEASPAILSRVWQMLLKAHEEVRTAPHPVAAAEMALIRIAYAADLPSPEEALKALGRGETPPAPAPPPGGGGGGGGAVRAASGGGVAVANVRAVAEPERAALLQTFDDVVKLIDSKRDVTLKLDVERFVRLVDFKPGVISFEPAPGAPANLSQRLSARLREWTGQRWMMDLQVGGRESVHDRRQREAAETRAGVEADPFLVALREAFPGAELVSVRQVEADVLPSTVAEPSEDD